LYVLVVGSFVSVVGRAVLAFIIVVGCSLVMLLVGILKLVE
jgi:hypothetical protein